ncbi:DUF3073 domain-containing protein [Bifidobacterium bombi]|uniref:DUF3073 domain-containing protein n=1 Tax=Bifidobacterium bombi TaxID=471511 RepID=UPI0005C54791|nr:DUF3073 domain-containing protein [Bifidobacterium bombi]
MGRGRQKAKQKKIARKLKYLTTDTDYDELAKELKGHESDSDSVDVSADDNVDQGFDRFSEGEDRLAQPSLSHSKVSTDEDDLDEYAKWAAEAAARATEKAAVASAGAASTKKIAHKPFPMPLPTILKKPTTK